MTGRGEGCTGIAVSVSGDDAILHDHVAAVADAPARVGPDEAVAAHERITRPRNLTLFLSGLYLSRKVHLSLIVRKWPTAGKMPKLVNRLRHLLDNPRVCVGG